MAGHVAAMRALREGRHPLGFDPFGENADSDSEEEADDDVEEAGDLNSDDERLASTGVRVEGGPAGADPAMQAAAKPAAVAASALPTPPLAPPEPPPAPLKALNVVWNATCSAVYEDEEAEVFCVRFSPDDTMLAVGCGDGVVRVFAADGGKLLYVLERETWRPKLPTTCLRFRPPTETSKTRNVLLVGNADGTVQHWHITSRKTLHTITEEDNQIYAIDYRADGTRFASAGKDKTVRWAQVALKPECLALRIHRLDQIPSARCI